MPVILAVRVTPRSSRNMMERQTDGSFRLFLTAHPHDGEANLAAIQLIAKTFGVAKSAVDLIRGHKSRDKVFCISGISDQDVEARFGGELA